MTKRQRRRKERLRRHAPQLIAVGVVAVGLADYALPTEICLRTCADPGGDQPMMLPVNFSFEPLPTPVTHSPVLMPAAASGGTAVESPPLRLRWDLR